ncbi:transposase [Methylocapsa sp. S129]|uniref:transposase n=1 Tax=Methylocapsa sp. S129 TaxID=1641869 RepID=UPI00131B89C4|nr:transposase [Methylocapsa sp. S129]
MTRIARIVVPGLPHHVTQRGNRREKIFFEADDYALYRDWLAESCRRFGVSCCAYCLMPNHAHLILTPQDASGLALALSRAHRLYAGYVNARARQTGHLFQGRFGSLAMDEDHLMAAARYVALNPVRARLAARAQDWPHSSVRAHLQGRNDSLVEVGPLLARAPRFADLLDGEADDDSFIPLRRGELIGRPLGAPAFLDAISRQLGRSVTPGKRGPKPKGHVVAKPGKTRANKGLTGVSP